MQIDQSGKLLQQRYKIEKQIGQGGMGAVYVAVDERFGSTVAIKQTLCMDNNYRKALEREARLLNSLKHVALPRVSDHFVEDEGQYIVMEYIPGEDLCCILDDRGEPFPAEQVIKWADQLLDALDFLHNQANPVIHRDIKPQNLKLNTNGQVILLDFGLAKGNPTDAQNQTAAKSIFGYSRNYASLEQIQGTGTDPRSDLYSLAATLYHLVTGVPPEDALTRAMAVLTHQPDPLTPAHLLRPDIPPGFSAVLQRTLDLNAGNRPASANEMRSMIRNHESYADTAATYVEGAGTSSHLHDQKTRLMPDHTNPVVPASTDIRTEVLPANDSQITKARSLAETDPVGSSEPAAKGRSSGGKLALTAAGLITLLLSGAVLGGFLYYETSLSEPDGSITKDSVPEPIAAGSDNAVSGSDLLDANSAISDNNSSNLAESQSSHVTSTSEKKKPASLGSPGGNLDSGQATGVDTIIVDGDNVYMGNTKITPDGIERRDPTMDPVPPVPPEIRLTPEQLRNLTPAQRRRLRTVIRRTNANVVLSPTP